MPEPPSTAGPDGPGEPVVPPPPLAPGLTRPLPAPAAAAYPPAPWSGPPARRALGARAAVVLVTAGVLLCAAAVTAAVAFVPRAFDDDGPRRPDRGTHTRPLPAGGTAAYADGVRVTVGQVTVADTTQAASDAGAAVRFTVTVRNGSSRDLRISEGDVSAFTEGDDAGPAYDKLTGTLAPGAGHSARFTVMVPDEETLEVDVAPGRSYGSAVWRLDVPS